MLPGMGDDDLKAQHPRMCRTQLGCSQLPSLVSPRLYFSTPLRDCRSSLLLCCFSALHTWPLYCRSSHLLWCFTLSISASSLLRSFTNCVTCWCHFSLITDSQMIPRLWPSLTTCQSFKQASHTFPQAWDELPVDIYQHLSLSQTLHVSVSGWEPS